MTKIWLAPIQRLAGDGKAPVHYLQQYLVVDGVKRRTKVQKDDSADVARVYRLDNLIMHGSNSEFGYNSAESEPIWMKFESILWAKCWGLAPADFGRDIATVWEGAEILFLFLVMRITYGLADFPLNKFYDISTLQRRSVSPCKLSEQNFENFTIRGRFSKKPAKIAKNFPGLATSGRQAVRRIVHVSNSQVTFKANEDYWCRCHSIGHYDFFY